MSLGFRIFEILVFSAMAVSGSVSRAAGLTEGLLVEVKLTQGASVVGGRVLIEAGRSDWTTVVDENSSKAKPSETLKLEARATLLEPDVVEVETRVTGARTEGRSNTTSEQTGKLIVRLGESATITTSQMESTGVGANGAPSDGNKETAIGVKVLRVRYSL